MKYTRPYNAESLKYMANGEIGIVVGEWIKSESKEKPKVLISFSSQQGYAYSFFQGSFDDGEDSYDFELAYCISVHKSQGSGFKSTFLILSAKNPMLSRELLYTALTPRRLSAVNRYEPISANKIEPLLNRSNDNNIH